jgi:hypothetical protein
MKSFELVGLAATITLMACGPSGPPLSKQGAATAVYESSLTGGGLDGLTNGVHVSGSCSNAGSATVVGIHQGVSLTDGVSVIQTVDISLSNCTDDGKTYRDGQISVGQQVSASQTTTSVRQYLKGTMTVSGAVSDHLDYELTEAVGVTTGGATSVSIVLDGHIQSSTQNFVFSNETLSITPGDFQH